MSAVQLNKMEVLLVVGEANLPYFNESGEVLIHNVISKCFYVIFFIDFLFSVE